MIFFVSCSTSKYTLRNKKNIESMKRLAYCDCLTFAIDKFIAKDSVDISDGNSLNHFEFIGGYFSRNILPVLDSAAKNISNKESSNQFHTGNTQVSEGRNGKVEYKIACLDFYKSKHLDSLTRALNKKINDSLRNDDNYKLMLKK